MDYDNEYKNATMIIDQSAWQQVGFWLTDNDLNIYPFLHEKNIHIITTGDSLKELSYQSYNPNLFGGHIGSSVTKSADNNKIDFVLSSSNGSLTLDSLDIHGFKIINEGKDPRDDRSQLLLWDSSPAFRRMERNKRSLADIQLIYLARRFFKLKANFFIFSNDKDQIKQAEIERFKYLRPADFLIWMFSSKYITKQKAVWVFEKSKRKNTRWMPKESFRDLLNKFKLNNFMKNKSLNKK